MISYTGDLYRELHYIKKADDLDNGYEPSMVILNRNKPGKSFIIPLSAMWKYVDPEQYKDDDKAVKTDWDAFNEIALRARQMFEGKSTLACMIWTPETRKSMQQEGFANLAACHFAYGYHKRTGILLCTAYNLAKLMQQFDFNVKSWPAAASQLLMWIQDRLDDLKNMPEKADDDHEYCVGEAKIEVNGQSLGTQDMMFSETDVLIQERMN